MSVYTTSLTAGGVEKRVTSLFLVQDQTLTHMNVGTTFCDDNNPRFLAFVYSSGVFKSSLRESKSPSPSSLRNLLLKLLGLLLTLEGKRCTNGRGLSEERGDKPAKMNRLTRLLDTKIDRARGDQMDSLKGNGGQNEPNGESNACTESTGSEMCRVLLDVYEHAQSRSVGVPDEERGLVPAVLSSLLALSKSAKDTALQGGYELRGKKGHEFFCRVYNLARAPVVQDFTISA